MIELKSLTAVRYMVNHNNKNWKIKERFTNNNGLTILEKL